MTFTFDAGDPASIFTVRIRQPGHGAVKSKDYLVDPATHTSPRTVSFSWEPLTVDAPTEYVVDVRRQDGGSVITSETFSVLPALVSRMSAKPSPFYPLVQDGYRDDTTIRFSLSADATDTTARVFAADQYGRCCGAEIRTDDLGPLASGAHGWVWDGTETGSSLATKGTYFARVEATDANAVSMVAKPLEIELTRERIRLTATKQKRGSAYARVGNEEANARGGDCLVSRDSADHQVRIVCANAAISVYWRWNLQPGEHIESVSFVVRDGTFGCHRTKGTKKTSSFLRVKAPPTSTCAVDTARIKYSYPVQA